MHSDSCRAVLCWTLEGGRYTMHSAWSTADMLAFVHASCYYSFESGSGLIGRVDVSNEHGINRNERFKAVLQEQAKEGHEGRYIGDGVDGAKSSDPEFREQIARWRRERDQLIMEEAELRRRKPPIAMD